MKKLILALLAASTILVSCKKDSDKKPDDSAGSSRTVQYEVTGNFTGSLIASYTTAAGGTVNDEITALPWTKEIVYAKSVTAAIIAISGGGGVAGQKVKLVIKRGGTQVGTAMEAVAGPSGGFSQAAPVIVF
ncbi:hypothetical protein SAMN05421820_102593 [Pedobacter steynii]|uniref:Lipoprotein n=1 Tax=Pedobacter steynii TaxID=430522 RepID=A0A1G9PA60_9SPHI|nr:hypothetical protein [Pedobacter steynii]NQX39046.1 hypothetical protein [Pedobacter steynii]SDL95649.1 hypothetical protein SAMN05421820_102593 [Pedobacter steynii]